MSEKKMETSLKDSAVTISLAFSFSAMGPKQKYQWAQSIPRVSLLLLPFTLLEKKISWFSWPGFAHLKSKITMLLILFWNDWLRLKSFLFHSYRSIPYHSLYQQLQRLICSPHVVSTRNVLSSITSNLDNRLMLTWRPWFKHPEFTCDIAFTWEKLIQDIFCAFLFFVQEFGSLC